MDGPKTIQFFSSHGKSSYGNGIKDSSPGTYLMEMEFSFCGHRPTALSVEFAKSESDVLIHARIQRERGCLPFATVPKTLTGVCEEGRNLLI